MKIKSLKDGKRFIQYKQGDMHGKVYLPRGISSAEEKVVLTITKSRLLDLKVKSDKFAEWDIKEKRHWIKTGEKPSVVKTEKLTFKEVVNQYKKEKQIAGKAFTYLRSIEHHNKRPLAFFGNDRRLDRLTVLDAQNLVDHLAKSKITNGKNRGGFLSNATIKKILRQLTSIFKFAKTKLSQGCDADIFSMVNLPIAKTNPLDELTPYQSFDARCSSLSVKKIDPSTEGAFHKIIYTNHELKEHLNYLKSKLWDDGDLDSRRLYAAVLFCSYTGCRRGEIMRVTKEDIDLDNRKAIIRIRKGRKDKAIRLHRVDLMECLIPILKGLIAQTPNAQKCLFSRSDDHLLDGGYNEELEVNESDSLHKSLKTAIQDSKWKYVTGLHVYRHSFASMLFTSGMTDLEVMKIVGWDTSEMAAHYSHLTEESTREKLSGILPALGGDEIKK